VYSRGELNNKWPIRESAGIQKTAETKQHQKKFIVRVSMAYNSQIEKKKTILLIKYESETQNVLFCNSVLAALISGRKYDVIHQNGDCSRERNVRTLVFEIKSDNNLESLSTFS
jgi:hypothetical protein